MLYVQHGNPDDTQKMLLSKIKELSEDFTSKVTSSSRNISSNDFYDDDLPDFATLNRLKQFKEQHSRVGR